jgi:hypothetical protein
VNGWRGELETRESEMANCAGKEKGNAVGTGSRPPMHGRYIEKSMCKAYTCYNREVEKEMARGGAKSSVPCIHSNMLSSITSMHYAEATCCGGESKKLY